MHFASPARRAAVLLTASSWGRKRRRAGAVLALIALTVAAGCSRSAQSHLDAGDKYVAEKKPAEALIEYRNAVQRDPVFAPARVKLAEAYLKGGQGERAIDEYVRAADLLPRDVDVQLKAGGLLLRAKRFDDAASRADKALAIKPGSADAHVLRANALAGLSDFGGAVEQMQQALAIEGKTGYYANLGAIQLAQGKRAEAEQAFRKGLELDPKSLPAQMAWINFLWAAGRSEEAEVALRQAHALAPADRTVNGALATYYLAVGRRAEAEPYLRQVAGASEDAGPKLALANFYVAMGRKAEAEQVLDTLAANPRHWATARTQVAQLRLTEGRGDEARAMLDEVLKKEPANRAARLASARVAVNARKLTEAEQILEQIVKEEPRDADAQYLLGTLKAGTGRLDEASRAFEEVLRINPRASAAQVQLARIGLLRGSPAAAVERAGEALRHAPNDPVARLMLVRGHLAKRELVEAEKELRPLVDAFPKAAEVLIELGRLRQQQGSLGQARTAFDRALAADPRSLDALSGLVAVDFADSRPAVARDRVAKVLAQTPGDSRLHTLFARTQLANRDQTSAEASLRKAIELDPGNLTAYELLGRVYIGRGKLDEAVAEFEALAGKQAKPVAARTMVAIIRQSQGRAAEARGLYEQVLKIDPQAVVAANNLAWMYAETSTRLDVALQLAKMAKAAQPGLAAIDDTLGFVYLQKQEADLAVPPLRDAVAKEPSNPLYRYRLGLAYARSGKADAARRELRQALELKADFSGADDARRVLSTLG